MVPAAWPEATQQVLDGSVSERPNSRNEVCRITSLSESRDLWDGPSPGLPLGPLAWCWRGQGLPKPRSSRHLDGGAGRVGAQARPEPAPHSPGGAGPSTGGGAPRKAPPRPRPPAPQSRRLGAQLPRNFSRVPGPTEARA